MKKLFTIIIAIILLAAAVSGIISYTQLKQQEGELSSTKKRIESAKDEITQTRKEIADLEKQNESLEQRIFKAQDQMHNYNNRISSLKN